MKEPEYHITAINPLTRLREPICVPCSRERAEKLLLRVKKKKSGKRYWLYPKLEKCQPQQLSLNFNT